MGVTGIKGKAALFLALGSLFIVPGCRGPEDQKPGYAKYSPEDRSYRSRRAFTAAAGPSHVPAGGDSPLGTSSTIKAGMAAAEQGKHPEPAGKENTRSISLADALESAISQNVESALARAEVEIARKDAQISFGKLVPALEFGGRISRTDGTVQGSFGGLRDVEFGTYEHGAALTYRLNPGALIHERIAADLALEEATLHALDVEQRLILRVAELYQDLLLAKENLRIAEALLEDRKKFAEVLKKRASAGVGLGSEVARAEANLARDRRHLVDARNRWESTSVRLAVVHRYDPDTLLVPVEDEVSSWSILPDAEMSDLEARAQDRPDVEAARLAEEGALHRVSAAWWDLFGPDLTATAGLHFIGDKFRDTDRRYDYGMILSWRISLDSFSRIGRLQAEEEAAYLRSQAAQDRARGEIESAHYALDAARERSRYAEDGLRAAEDNHRLSLSRFEAGTAIVLEVLDAENALALARLDLVRSFVDYNRAQLWLIASLGVIHEEVLPGR